MLQPRNHTNQRRHRQNGVQDIARQDDLLTETYGRGQHKPHSHNYRQSSQSNNTNTNMRYENDRRTSSSSSSRAWRSNDGHDAYNYSSHERYSRDGRDDYEVMASQEWAGRGEDTRRYGRQRDDWGYESYAAVTSYAESSAPYSGHYDMGHEEYDPWNPTTRPRFDDPSTEPNSMSWRRGDTSKVGQKRRNDGSWNTQHRRSDWKETSMWEVPPSAPPLTNSEVDRSWEPGPGWEERVGASAHNYQQQQQQPRHHQQQHHNHHQQQQQQPHQRRTQRNNYQNNYNGNNRASKTGMKRNPQQQRRDWRQDDDDFNNWQRRDVKQGGAQPRTRSPSPSGSYYSKNSPRGRSHSPDVSPQVKRRRRDSSLQAYRRPSPTFSDRGRQGFAQDYRPKRQPSPSSSRRSDNLPRKRRRSPSSPSSVSSERSRSPENNSKQLHRLPISTPIGTFTSPHSRQQQHGKDRYQNGNRNFNERRRSPKFQSEAWRPEVQSVPETPFAPAPPPSSTSVPVPQEIQNLQRRLKAYSALPSQPEPVYVPVPTMVQVQEQPPPMPTPAPTQESAPTPVATPPVPVSAQPAMPVRSMPIQGVSNSLNTPVPPQATELSKPALSQTVSKPKKHAGFKPIGSAYQSDSALKRFFPGEEDDTNGQAKSDADTMMSVPMVNTVLQMPPPPPPTQPSLPSTPFEVRTASVITPATSGVGEGAGASLTPQATHNVPEPQLPFSVPSGVQDTPMSESTTAMPTPTPTLPIDATPSQREETKPEIALPETSSSKKTVERMKVERKGQANGSSQHRPELFTILNQVGEGTFGKVYKAQNTVSQLYVALKRIRMEHEKDGFPVTAMREIKLLQSLRHQNVVRLYEMMVSNANVYMVFEYMDHDLTGILSQTQFTFTDSHLKSLCHQMLAGLAYLHHKGVIHRDIKGSNILINNRGELKLGDFGLARFYQKRRRADYTNRVITLWYRPPELLLGATVYGPEVDMWSAGCIMLELFTKKPVFQGDDEIHQLDVIYRVLGTPTVERWPDLVDLPWYELVKPTNTCANHFKDLFKKWMSPAALNLAERLLTYDPSTRASATQAMEDPYFTEEEPPADMPVGLATLKGEWHELETKKEKAKKKRRESTIPET